MSDNIFAIMDKTINSISNVNVRNQAIKAAEFARNNNDVKNAAELIKLLGLSARNGDIPIFYTGYGPNGVLYGEDGNDEMQGQGGNDLLMGFTASNDAKQTLVDRNDEVASVLHCKLFQVYPNPGCRIEDQVGIFSMTAHFNRTQLADVNQIRHHARRFTACLTVPVP